MSRIVRTVSLLLALLIICVTLTPAYSKSYRGGSYSSHHNTHRYVRPQTTLECAPCASSNECQTGKCWGTRNLGYKCVKKNSNSSLQKCFPHAGRPSKPTLLGECAKCRRSYECSTGKCCGQQGGKRKCVAKDSRSSMQKCFPKNGGPSKPTPLGECAKCRRSYECSTGKCWGKRRGERKCVAKDSRSSMQKCFPKNGGPSKPTPLGECAKCRRSYECGTGKCWGKRSGERKCIVKDSSSSMQKCFPPHASVSPSPSASPQQLDICEACTADSQCETNKCFKNKCTEDTDESKATCHGLKQKCEACDSNDDCLFGMCFRPDGRETEEKKCVKKGDSATVQECFPPKGKECDTCQETTDCDEGKCWNGKCVFSGGSAEQDQASREKCFPPKSFCEDCTKDDDCLSNKCFQNKCTEDNDDSKATCHGLKPICSNCSSNEECLYGKCAGGPTGESKCVKDTAGSFDRCFADTLDECEPCHESIHCKTGKCWGDNNLGYKCVKEGDKTSMDFCFPGIANCEACEEDDECQSKICYRHLCVATADEEGIKQCSTN